MYNFRKCISFCLLLIFLFTVLSSCTVKRYYKSDADKVENKGQKLLEKYFDAEFDDYEIVSIYMVDGRGEGAPFYAGSYISSYVYCMVDVGGHRYKIYADVDTGEIWTDRYLYLLNKIVENKISELWKDTGIDSEFAFRFCENYLSHTYKNKKGETLIVDMHNVLPSYVNENNYMDYADEILEKSIITSFNLYYSSENTREFNTDFVDNVYRSALGYDYNDYPQLLFYYTALNIDEESLDRLINNSEYKLSKDEADIKEKYNGQYEVLMNGDNTVNYESFVMIYNDDKDHKEICRLPEYR